MPYSQFLGWFLLGVAFILTVAVMVGLRKSVSKSYPIRVWGASSPVASWVVHWAQEIRRQWPLWMANLKGFIVQKIKNVRDGNMSTIAEGISVKTDSRHNEIPSSFYLFRFLRNFWKEEVSGNEPRAIQIIFTLAVIVVNILISYAYIEDLMIRGWQIGVWLGSIVMTLLILVTPRKFKISFNKSGLALWVLIIAAFLLRGISLDQLPRGLHGDEFATADFTMRYVFQDFEQTLNPFQSGLHSQPTLYNYFIRLSFYLAGYTEIGLRLPNAIAGAFAVLATFFLVSVSQNRRAAWLAAIFMACYQYHIQWSRIGLNNVWATLWVPLALACFLWGWRERWNGGAVLGGIALGLAGYFYAGGAIVVILLLFIFGDLWIKHRSEADRHQLLIYAGKMIAMALVVVGPLMLFAVLKPDFFFERGRSVFMWRPDVIAQEIGFADQYMDFFWRQLLRAFGSYTAYIDGSGFYAPGIPFLIGLAGPLMVVGLGWSLYKRQYLIPVWLVTVTFLGGIVVAPGSAHLISSIPAICMSVAAALNWLMEWGWKRWAYGMFFIILITELTFYFITYPAVPRGDLNLPMPPLP